MTDAATTPAGLAGFLARRRFDSLDALRCFCILAVIWHHTPGRRSVDLQILQRGFLGVDMFFVLSGFLITTLLIRERARHGRISLPAFWARRSLRIFPIYYITLLAVVGAYAVLRPRDPETKALLSDLPWHVFYLSNWKHEIAGNFGPLWSLAAEEQFYLLWPLVEALAAVWARRTILIALIAVNALVAVRFLVPSLFEGGAAHPVFRLEIMQTTFLPILFGVALAHALHNPVWHPRLAPLVAWRWAPVFWAGVLLALMQFVPGDIQGLPRISMQLAMTVVVASTVVQASHALTPILNLPPLRRVGEVSYAMYLFHMWAIDLVRRVAPRLGLDAEPWPPLLFAASALATYAAAEVSFRLIEAPILRFKTRFARVDMGRERPAADPPAP